MILAQTHEGNDVEHEHEYSLAQKSVSVAIQTQKEKIVKAAALHAAALGAPSHVLEIASFLLSTDMLKCKIQTKVKALCVIIARKIVVFSKLERPERKAIEGQA